MFDRHNINVKGVPFDAYRLLSILLFIMSTSYRLASFFFYYFKANLFNGLIQALY
jgi:hypothetical protein